MQSGVPRSLSKILIFKMISITDTISIDEKDIREEFIRSSGPGGQNVNKVATAVQLRFDIANSASIPEEIKARLIRLSGRRITADGVLILTARRFRTREKNREDAFDRLARLIRKACEKPKNRRKTRPTASSREERLQKKSIKSRKKKMRSPLIHEE